jgi:hypothetical protein
VGGAGYFGVATGIAGSGLDPTCRGGSGRAGGTSGGGAEGDDAGRTGEGDEAGWSAGVGGADVGAGGASDWLPGASDGRGGLAGDGSGSGLLQPEKGGSGLEIGGNSDSGGPDDTRPDGDVSGGSAEWPRGAKGGRAETRKPQASQN